MNTKLDDTISKAMGAAEHTGDMIKAEAALLKGKMKQVGMRMAEAGEEAMENSKEAIAEKTNELLAEFHSRR